MTLAIGPEGGWTSEEERWFAEQGWQSASLGSTVLRAETAAIAAVAVASMEAAKLLRSECDALVCLETPADFSAVGQFFNDFSQVSDQEVMDLLSARQEKASACA